jgi:hypothetical protein
VALGCSRPSAKPDSESTSPANPAKSTDKVTKAAASTPNTPSPVILEAWPTIKSHCCVIEKRKGLNGDAHKIHTKYTVDILSRTGGEPRLIPPDDIVADMQELLIFARSAKRSLHQERQLRLVGETKHWVSVEVLETGDTGQKPIQRGYCKTVQIYRGKHAQLSDVLKKEHAESLEQWGKKQLIDLGYKDKYKFSSSSFVVRELSGEKQIRFCAPQINGVKFFLLEKPLPSEAWK